MRMERDFSPLTKHTLISGIVFAAVSALPLYTSLKGDSFWLIFFWLFFSLWLPYVTAQAISIFFRNETFPILSPRRIWEFTGMHFFYNLLWYAITILLMASTGFLIERTIGFPRVGS